MLADDMDWFMHASMNGHPFKGRAAALGRAMPVSLPVPQLTRWHVASQDRVFHHLSTIWGNKAPRTMIDLGCHASHGVHANVSDALLWLDRFNASGGAVLAVDLFEDFALDVQRRMDLVPPYGTIRNMRKRALTVAISAETSGLQNFAHVARSHATSCASPSKAVLEARGSDHMCGMTRMRLGLLPTAPWLDAYPSSYPKEVLRRLAGLNTTSHAPSHAPLPTRSLHYPVRRMSLDQLWEEELHGGQIDFLKVDIDSPWTALGFERMLRARAFRVMTIEVDGSWGDILPDWQVSRLDQLAWTGRAHGYDTYLKVACIAKPRAGSLEAGRWFKSRTPRKTGRWVPGNDVWAAYLWPLANRSAFTPSRYHARRQHGIQDAMLIDAMDTTLSTLPTLLQGDCEVDERVASQRLSSRDEPQ